MRRSLSLFSMICLGAISSWAAVDSSLLGLVPPGASVIASVDVTKSRDSDFGQYLLSRQQMGDQGFERMIEQTGFDPRRDLQHLLVASFGAGRDGNAPSFTILARGTFDEGRIQAAATAKSVTIQNYQGVAIFVNPEHDGHTAFAFLDTGIAAMADLPTLKQIIANRAAPTTLSTDLQNRIHAIGTDNDVWFVSTTPGGFWEQRMLNEAGPRAQAFESITQSSGGIRFGSLVQASFQATTRSPQDANALGDVVRFIASMVQMQQDSPSAALLAPALSSMALETADNTLHLSVSIPEKNLEQLAELRPSHSHFNRRMR